MDPFALALANNRHAAVLCADAAGQAVYANHRWVTMFDHSEAGYGALIVCIDEEFAERSRAMLAEADAQATDVHFHARVLVEGGGPTWMSIAHAPVRDASGELVGWITSVSDMAARRQSADGAQASNGAVSLAERAVGVGAWEWDIAAGTLWMSDGCTHIYGLAGGHQPPSFDDAFELIHPDDRDESVRVTVEALKDRNAYELRHRIRRQDGSIAHVVEQAEVVREEQGNAVKVLATMRDITADVLEFEHRARASRALATLTRGNEVIVRATDEQQLLQQMCDAAIEAGRYRLAWYGRVERDDERTVRPLAASGPAIAYMDGLSVTWGNGPTADGPSGRAVKTQSTVVVEDFMLDPRYAPWLPRAQALGLRSSVAIPVRAQGEIVGLIMVYAAEPMAFDEGSVESLEQLAVELGLGLERIWASQRMTDALEGTVRVLAATVELRDPYTAGHQSRVADLAVRIGTELGLDESELRGVHLAGLVHDIGKASVPTELLTRPGQLRPVELELIKEHARLGEELLSTIDFPWPIAQIVGQHHERWNGSGYPRALSGTEILLPARIIGVADVVEAMERFRPYREGLGSEVALEEITRNREVLYDPDVVDACLRVFAAGYTFDYSAS